MNTHSAKQRSPHDLTPAMEWIFGSIGAALFLLGLTFLVSEGTQGVDKPGAVSFHVEEITPTGGAYLVRYSAQNHGSQTLADVEISAQLFEGAAEIEIAHARIDFLPGDSKREGGFYLQHDPRRYRLEIRAEGYQEP